MAWATWRVTIAFTLAVLVLRIIYLAWLCPYELVFDEAQYWDWSRRTELSYATKGPGIAYTIRATTALFGDGEWAVRLAAPCYGALLMLVAARMAMRLARGDERAGFVAAAMMVLMPGYAGTALLLTIDGPLFAWWIIAAWAAWVVADRLRQGESAAWPLLALGAAAGVGTLYKYTMLLVAVGIIVYFIWERREMKWSRAAIGGAIAAAALAACSFLPILLWNAQRGWPTVHHLMDHLSADAGASVQGAARAGFNPVGTLELIGAQLGFVGPALLLMGGALIAAIRRRRTDARRWSDQLLLILCAAPVLGMYLVISPFTKPQGNWPLAGYATLVVLAAPRVLEELDRRWPHGWRATVIYGGIAAIAMLWLNLLATLPLLEKVIPYHRFSGNEARAMQVDAARAQVREATGREPLVVAERYTLTALLAYYLPDQPRVGCASSYVGGRTVAYDFFDDVDLEASDKRGRPVVLVGKPRAGWRATDQFRRVEPIGRSSGRDWPVFKGWNGVVPGEHATNDGS